MTHRLDRLYYATDFASAKTHIYGLAHNVCHTGQEQRALITVLHKIEEECIGRGASGSETIQQLMFPIMNGLMYGNWPWIKNGVDTLKEKV